jgi:integrase
MQLVEIKGISKRQKKPIVLTVEQYYLKDGIGWHTFRHTYRSWLDDTGAPMGVQQKLMRHAQISTTKNVYGNALMEANTKVVRKALRSA